MKRQYTDPRTDLKRMGIIGRDCLVLLDLDKTVRWDNQPVPKENRRAIKQFGGLTIPITGSPIRYTPPFLRTPIALAEFGAVLCTKTRYWVLTSPKEQEALKRLRLFLGLFVEDGVQEVIGGEVAVGGPRYASLNLNVGRHPAYPKIRWPAKPDPLVAEIEHYLPCEPLLRMAVNDFGEYQSIDVTTQFTKGEAVRWLLEVLNPSTKYYLGDGESDLEAMLLPGIIAVGFENSCKGIKALAQIYVDRPGPDGGAAEALEIIQKREQTKLVPA